jgi:hypothetical protein
MTIAAISPEVLIAPTVAVLPGLPFLGKAGAEIHSLVLVGSHVFAAQTSNSDIDLVVIAAEEAAENLCAALLDRELAAAARPGDEDEYEITILTKGQTEAVFAQASPFAYSIRYGRVLFDDGYLAALLKTPFPQIPTEEYYVSSFFEGIASQYFNIIKGSEKSRKQACPACRGRDCGCRELPAAAQLPRIIFKMLYLALPLRGLMPLTKSDAVSFAETFYPPEISSEIAVAAELLRSQEGVARSAYPGLKKTGIFLFREILAALGHLQAVRQSLHDAASAARASFQRISNPALRNALL